jgi:hypothetical protein
MAMPVFGRWGFGLNVSNGTDVLQWSSFSRGTVYPPVSFAEDISVDQGWGRDATSRQYYNYASIISPEGDSNTVGQTFYLYYVKVFPGEDFDRRYQMRRKVTLLNSPSSSYLVRVALSRYADASGRSKVSTEIAKPSEGYAFSGRMGYVLSYAESGFQSLAECYAPASQTYFLSTADPAAWNWDHCESPDDTFVRRIGYIASSLGSETDRPLYRCKTLDAGVLYTSLDPCTGSFTESTLGYLFSKGFTTLRSRRRR